MRDLSGAITLILAYAGLTGERIDVSLARKALARGGGMVQPRGDLETVERVILAQFRLRPADLRGRRTRRTVRTARYLCMYLARQCTTASCREIARHFGSANHSTVVFSVSRMKEIMAKDPDIAELTAALGEKIRKG